MDWFGPTDASNMPGNLGQEESQRRADAAPLVLRSHRQRAEDLHLHHASWCVEQAAGEPDVSEDLARRLGDQREPGVCGDRAAQALHEVGDQPSVVTEPADSMS